MKYSSPFHALTLICFVLWGLACRGQEKSKISDDVKYIQSSPTVIRNFKAVAVAPDYDTSLVSQYIRSIFQDSKGNMWFGTLGEGVVRYDKKTLTYFSHPEGFINNTVYAIAEDHAGNMWFGTDQGVYRYDGKTFRNYHQKDGLQHLDISRKGILVDQQGRLWVGTHGGVYRYDPIKDAAGSPCFSLFPLLPPINVAGIMEDNEGNIWFATTGKGVFRYDGNSVVNFNEIEGLGENYAGGIAQDPQGFMWFTMRTGVCRFDGKTFTKYTAQDGLGGTEFWGILVERSGIVWITARGSTTRFDPSLALRDKKACTIFTPEDGLNCCVQSMYQDDSGRVWLGAGSGLFRFDGRKFHKVKQEGPW